MRSVGIHAALLAIAVALAVPTFTRELARAEPGIAVWGQDGAEVMAIRYRSPSKEVDLERREEDGEAFLWGVEITREDAGAAPDTLAFPVGAYGSQLLDGFAALRVTRTLGAVTPDREAELGLDEPAGRIAVHFRDGPRELVLGDPVYGASGHYALDTASGATLVVSAELIEPLQIGSAALRERQVHRFLVEDVGRVSVQAGGRERSALRLPDDASASARWASPGTPDLPDVTFANFMERVSQLAIEGFETSVDGDSLEMLLRLEYHDREGSLLGFVELFRAPSTGTQRYYLRSERTRVAAAAIALLAERVEQVLPEIF